MKKNLIPLALLCIALLFSCKKQPQQSESVEGMPSIEQLQQDEIDDMLSLINEVSSCIDSIQIQEKLIFESKEGVNTKEKMLAQLRSFKDVLAQKQALIDSLTAKNSSVSSSSKKTIQNLEKMIEFINAQLLEKTKKVESLEAAIQKKDAKIDELRYDLDEMTQVSDYLKEQNYQQDRELNTVYYIVATKKELKEMGLLKQKFLGSKKVQNDNIDNSLFKKADKRNLKTIPVDEKKVTLLTNNPAGSYNLTTGDYGTPVLEITDPDKFWSISPYLIIQK